MYRFVDTNQVAQNNAPSIQFLYNGINLDRRIRGYRTLAVHGRTLLGRDISTKPLDTLGVTAGGGIFLSSRLPEREIIVEFALQAENNTLFRDASRQLAHALHYDDECELIFTDELHYRYYGVFAEVEDIEEYSNAVIGEMTFICADPLKYGPLREVRLSNELVFPYKTKYEKFPVRIETVKAILEESASQAFTVENVDKGLKATMLGPFAKNDVVEIKRNLVILNGMPIMDRLDLHSQIENMEASFGDQLQVSVPATVTVRFREVSI